MYVSKYVMTIILNTQLYKCDLNAKNSQIELWMNIFLEKFSMKKKNLTKDV